MNLGTIGINSLWAGLCAIGLGIILAAPPRYLVSAFLCGVAGHFARDAFTGWGVSSNWSTFIAAVVIVLVAVVVIREHVVSPVVLVSGVLPLGASVAVFNTIVGLMKVSTLEGEALGAASTALIASLGKVFTTSLAIGVGLEVGMAVVQLVRRGKIWEGA